MERANVVFAMKMAETIEAMIVPEIDHLSDSEETVFWGQLSTICLGKIIGLTNRIPSQVQHDHKRLIRAISTPSDSKPKTKLACLGRIYALHDTITGLQSTDDPHPIYMQELDRLLPEYERLKGIVDSLPNEE